jgi:phospholipid/cholesterol/gamma-HCH transport system substrate-binding protein
MDLKANEIKVGLTVLVAFAVLVIFLVTIVGVDFNKKTTEYHTFFEYAGGIQEGTVVKYNGMDVGLVTGLELPKPSSPDSRIHITFEVAEGTPVRAETQAFLTVVGFLSEPHIELSPGPSTAALLPPGSEVPSKDVLSFARMAEPLAEMSDRAEELIESVDKLFDEKNQAHFASLMENMDQIVVDGGKQFINLVAHLEETTANLNEVSKSLNTLMANSSENFEETLAHLEKTTRETGELITELRTSVVQFESMVAANGASFVEIMENFQFASQNLEEFTRTVKERPWLLVRKSAPPQREIP